MKEAIELFVYTGLSMIVFGLVVILAMKLYDKHDAKEKEIKDLFETSAESYKRSQELLARLQKNNQIQTYNF